MNKKIFSMIAFSLILASVSVATAYAEDQPIASTWASAVPKIDGLKQDWEGTPLTSQKHDVQLGLQNDGQYLYILLVFTNPKNLSSIAQTGVTFYFDNEGKNKKDSGINFRRLQLTADEFIAMMEEKQGPLSAEEKAKYKANPSYSVFHYGIIHKSSKEILNADEAEGILPAVFRFGQEQMALCYEFAIPLKKATEMAPGIGTEAGKALALGIEWGGWSRQLKQSVASSMADAQMRAQDARGSEDLKGEGGDPSEVGGMRMGDAPGMAAMRKRQPKKYDFWVNIQLANTQ
jgi:hypothetical protein